jgi:hypothetical protein
MIPLFVHSSFCFMLVLLTEYYIDTWIIVNADWAGEEEFLREYDGPG